MDFEMENRTAEALSGEDEAQERLEVVDFKMVTFSLAGKDYGVDIMDVKEIAKAGRFTYVPNTAPFVLGVYNLRGDIIPIIDLRLFFHIPTKQRADDALESMIIVAVNDQSFGIVVDSIDKVVGISKESIQPPHPIFGDINIKYILGVVENMDRLYILLDVQRIFGGKAAAADAAERPSGGFDLAAPAVISDTGTEAAAPAPASGEQDEFDRTFIKDTLKTFKNFTLSSINEEWFVKRFQEWKESRGAANTQIQDEKDADAYLETFFSPFTGTLWDDEYASSFISLLPDISSRQINVWNPGCGRGYETYSVACALKERYPSARVKIYANDLDLLCVANAPNMSLEESAVPSRYKRYMVKTASGGYSFNQEIKDTILFEYHNCTNENPYPEMDIIVTRDLLSFLPAETQTKLLEDFSEKLKTDGVVVLGENEVMPHEQGWSRNSNGRVSAFSKT